MMCQGDDGTETKPGGGSVGVKLNYKDRRRRQLQRQRELDEDENENEDEGSEFIRIPFYFPFVQIFPYFEDKRH